jgi:hypothetical protein
LLDSPKSNRNILLPENKGYQTAGSDYHSIASERENALAGLCRDIKKKLPAEYFD